MQNRLGLFGAFSLFTTFSCAMSQCVDDAMFGLGL